MSSKHTITAWCPFGLQPDALETKITYYYTKGAAAIMYGTPQPADPEEIEFDSVRLWGYTIDVGMQKLLDEWAAEWLSDDYGREAAIEHVRSREDA